MKHKIPKINYELLERIKTRKATIDELLRCQECGKPFIKLNKEKEFGYYKPACKHISKNIRISVG